MAAAIPFAMKAAPYIAQGVGAMIGKKTSGPSGGQKAAMSGTEQSANMLQGAANPLLQQGGALARQGMQTMQPAGDYFRNILNTRQAARESLAPEMKNVLDFYSGASRKVGRTMTGGSRDYAQAELERDKVGNMALMQPMARASAAQGAGQIGNSLFGAGSDMTGQGMYGLGQSAALRSGQFNQATTVRNQEGAGGAQWGGMLFDIAKELPWGKKKPLPSRTPVPLGVPGTVPPALNMRQLT